MGGNEIRTPGKELRSSEKSLSAMLVSNHCDFDFGEGKDKVHVGYEHDDYFFGLRGSRHDCKLNRVPLRPQNSDLNDERRTHGESKLSSSSRNEKNGNISRPRICQKCE